MPDQPDIDLALSLLKAVSNSDKVSDESKEAAEECRQILLSLRRDRVPEERYSSVAERFIDNWDKFEAELVQEYGIICQLDTFAIEDDRVEMGVSADMGAIT